MSKISLILSFCLLIFSCNSIKDVDSLAKVNIYQAYNSKLQFSFLISDGFVKTDKSKLDPDYPIMTKSQVKILKKLLKKNNYCINNKDKLLFKVVSKQEKIYDLTLAGVFEKQYNAKPLMPLTYFGECL